MGKEYLARQIQKLLIADQQRANYVDFFDAYEEVYSALERFSDETGKAPHSISVSPSLFRWLLEMKKEAVTLHLEEPGSANTIHTRFGDIPLSIDELLSPYEVLVD